jgi:outer membrane lipoprotein-sorting protein
MTGKAFRGSNILFVCFLALIFLTGRIGFGQESPTNADQANLNKILETTGEYCERLNKMALHFVCHENIAEKTHEFDRTTSIKFVSSPEKNMAFTTIYDLKTARSVKRSYIYDYQMINLKGVLKEQRNLLEENGKRRNEQDIELKTVRWSAKYLVFGPIGFLSRSWQPHFQYEVLGNEKVGNRTAVILKAVPRDITSENNSSGRIWLDQDDMSILQIEWEPRSIAGFEDTVDTPIGKLQRKISWTVTYDVVKNGIRFPGAQTITEIYVTPNGKEHTKYEAAYKYDQYRFFTVETQVIYK